jgi:hypothetical protein
MCPMRQMSDPFVRFSTWTRPPVDYIAYQMRLDGGEDDDLSVCKR